MTKESSISEKERQSVSSSPSLGQKLRSSELFVLLIVLVVVFMVGAIARGSHFLNSTNFSNILRSGSVVGILGLGATCVILVGEFDLSIGSIMAFSAVAGATFITKTHLEVPGIIFTVLVGALAGMVNGLLVTKGKIKSLMATLGMMTLLSGCAEWISKGLPIYLYDFEIYMGIGKNKILGIPEPLYFFAIIAVVLGVIYSTTVIGKKIYYTGANPRAAHLCGINTDAYKIMGFMISGGCAAMAAIILCAMNSHAVNTIATGQEMTGIAVAVLGGTMLGGGRGNIWGSVIGAFIFQMILNVLALSGLGTYTEQTLKGLIVILVVIAYQVINERKRRSR